LLFKLVKNGMGVGVVAKFATDMPYQDIVHTPAGGSCTASVRLMHGVWSKPICGRNMSLLAGLTWGGSSLHSTPHDGLLTPWASRG
jgi:hypothetical protein